MLAEALDALAAAAWVPSAAGEAMGVSASQLVKFLKIEPAALGLVNSKRRETGLLALR